MFFLGASRGSLVAILLCIPFLIYYGSLKNKVRVLLLSIIAIPLLLYGVRTTGSAIFTRSENTIETGDASGRQELWAAAYKEFINNPIVGGRIEVSGVYPHNVFLEVLMSTGIIGFSLFFVVFFKSLERGLKVIKNKGSYIVPVLIFINGISESMFSGSIYGAILLFTPMGMIYSSYISTNLKKKIKPEFNKQSEV
jgi:O-antigen ligase